MFENLNLFNRLLSSSYQTPLTKSERIKFDKWVMENNIPITDDYDMQGFWLESQKPNSPFKSAPDPTDNYRIHYPDEFKTPLHPTFSDQSRYAKGLNAQKAGKWFGDIFLSPESILKKY